MRHTVSKLAPPPVFRPWHAGMLLASAGAAAGAVWVRAKARQAEHDHPPQGRYMHVDGVRLHYLERGSGPVLVMLHGNSFYMGDLLGSGLVDLLARRYRVILFDRPGFGHSSRPRDRLWTPQAQAALLHRALVALGVDRPLVLGHSLGAIVALAMALDFPASVAGLVLASGYYYPVANAGAVLASPVAMPLVGDALRYTVAPLVARLAWGRIAGAAFAPYDVPPHFFEAVARELALRPGQLRADAEDSLFMMTQARAMAHRYPQLRLPVAVLAGARDQVVDSDVHSRRLAAELPNTRLHIVPGAGHMVHYRAPQAFVAQVDAVFEAARTPRAPAIPDPQVAAAQLQPHPPLAWISDAGTRPA